MEYIIGIILSLIAAVFYFKSTGDKARSDSRIAETKGQDKILKENQEEVHKQIEELDKGIAKVKEELAKSRDNMSDQERADKWSK